MIKDPLKDEIYTLIALGTEGDYWDFKQRWHENNAELVHDIVCFANNQVNRDAYLIIGVTNSKSPSGIQIVGVPPDHRKTQQNVIDLLRSIKFIGGIRPTVYIHTISHAANVDLDIIIVKNTKNTPYFLSEAYKDGKKAVLSGHIYTRIGDTNTPINAFADMDKIECLWRKRFGIDLSINEKILMLLDRPSEWEGTLGSEREMYHRIYPEFRIRVAEKKEDSDDRGCKRNSITKNISDYFPDKGVSVYSVEIIYRSTKIYEDDLLLLDGARHMIPFPDSHTVCLDKYPVSKNSLTYQYYDFSTIKGKILRNLIHIDKSWYGGDQWYHPKGSIFLEFRDEQDKAQFDDFVKENLDALLENYPKALEAKGHTRNQATDENSSFGWSKGSEIKAHYLYDRYRGVADKTIDDYVFSPPSSSPPTI